MAIIDSYSESNRSTDNDLMGTYVSIYGQSFTGDGSQLGSAQFFIRKNQSPTGNAVAKIYAHSGSFGSSSLPTGAALATSNTVDVSTLSGSTEALSSFLFTGANQITLVNGTHYIVTIEYSGGDGSNFVDVAIDATSPTHAGNPSYYDSSWHYQTYYDLIFYVNSVGISPSASLSPSSSLSPSASVSPSVSPSSSFSSSPSPSPAPPSAQAILKIAKPGVNVLTNSDIDKLVFDSEYGTLKYFSKQAIHITFDASTGDISALGLYTHNLNYYPFCEVFVSVNGGNYEYCPFFGSGVSVAYSANFIITPTQIKVYGEINGMSGSVWTFDFLIFIYKNDLQLS